MEKDRQTHTQVYIISEYMFPANIDKKASKREKEKERERETATVAASANGINGEGINLASLLPPQRKQVLYASSRTNPFQTNQDGQKSANIRFKDGVKTDRHRLYDSESICKSERGRRA